MLVALLQGEKHMMRGLYLVGLPLTMQYIWIFEQLLAKYEPELSAHLVDLCVPTSSYTRYRHFFTCPEISSSNFTVSATVFCF